MFETPGVKNVGDRYAAQGGTSTHLPGVATPLGMFISTPALGCLGLRTCLLSRAHGTNMSVAGNADNTASNQTKMKGAGTGAFEKTHADQKVGYPTATEAQFTKAHLGNEKGK
jgi:hypothetical protein